MVKKNEKKMQLDNKKWLLKETRKMTKDAAKERAKSQPVPVDSLVEHMKEVRHKAALEKAEMKQKKTQEFQRLLKQERFYASKAVEHPKIFDPSGDYGNLANKEGKRAAVCWDVIERDHTSRQPASYISGPFRSSTVAPVDGKPAWVPPEEVETSFTQTPCTRFLISEASLLSMKERLQVNINHAQKSLGKTQTKTESLRKERQACEEGLASLRLEMRRLDSYIESRRMDKENRSVTSSKKTLESLKPT